MDFGYLKLEQFVEGWFIGFCVSEVSVPKV